MQNATIITVAIIFLIAGIFLYWKSRQLKVQIEKRESEMRRRMYELAILKELGDRVGYSLNVQNIIDIITGSLHQFIEYSATSYMLIEPEEIIFKVHLEKSVSRKFIEDIRERMLRSISALLNKDLKDVRVEEIMSGAILVEELEEPVKSFFNIPLVIADKVVGVLTIAHTEAGLYKEEEMTILYKIVQQASQAVTRLQKVVEEEERKLNAMVESMTEGVIMTDKNYRVMVANPAAKKAISAENKKEITIFDFIDKIGEKFDIRGKLEESVKLDKVLTSKDIFINNRFYQISVLPVKSDLGVNKEEIIGGLVIFHDITHDKEIEKLREDFTSMIVHDLRSPLDGTKKMIEVLLSRKLKDERKKEYLDIIYKNSSTMLNLVNNILDAAKSESGKFEIIKSPSDIKKIVKDRVNFFKASAQNAQVDLSAVFSGDLPAKADFDGIRTAQALDNFISNAIKYSNVGGQTVVNVLFYKNGGDLSRKAAEEKIKWFLNNEIKKLNKIPDSIIIAVTDSGIGISAEDIPELFSKFKQLKTTASKEKTLGTGLGLAIAKGITQAQGGIIGIESKKGEGSTFYFTIPLINNLK